MNAYNRGTTGASMNTGLVRAAARSRPGLPCRLIPATPMLEQADTVLPLNRSRKTGEGQAHGRKRTTRALLAARQRQMLTSRSKFVTEDDITKRGTPVLRQAYFFGFQYLDRSGE